MNRKDIIRMAREANLWMTSDERIAAVERFAALVAAEKDKEIERLREVLNKLEYYYDGTIRRYPDEYEVKVALQEQTR